MTFAKMMRKAAPAVLVFAVALISGCGGGSRDDDTSANGGESSASSSKKSRADDHIRVYAEKRDADDAHVYVRDAAFPSSRFDRTPLLNYTDLFAHYVAANADTLDLYAAGVTREILRQAPENAADCAPLNEISRDRFASRQYYEDAKQAFVDVLPSLRDGALEGAYKYSLLVQTNGYNFDEGAFFLNKDYVDGVTVALGGVFPGVRGRSDREVVEKPAPIIRCGQHSRILNSSGVRVHKASPQRLSMAFPASDDDDDTRYKVEMSEVDAGDYQERNPGRRADYPVMRLDILVETEAATSLANPLNFGTDSLTATTVFIRFVDPASGDVLKEIQQIAKDDDDDDVDPELRPLLSAQPLLTSYIAKMRALEDQPETLVDEAKVDILETIWVAEGRVRAQQDRSDKLRNGGGLINYNWETLRSDRVKPGEDDILRMLAAPDRDWSFVADHEDYDRRSNNVVGVFLLDGGPPDDRPLEAAARDKRPLLEAFLLDAHEVRPTRVVLRQEISAVEYDYDQEVLTFPGRASGAAEPPALELLQPMHDRYKTRSEYEAEPRGAVIVAPDDLGGRFAYDINRVVAQQSALQERLWTGNWDTQIEDSTYWGQPNQPGFNVRNAIVNHREGRINPISVLFLDRKLQLRDIPLEQEIAEPILADFDRRSRFQAIVTIDLRRGFWDSEHTGRGALAANLVNVKIHDHNGELVAIYLPDAFPETRD